MIKFFRKIRQNLLLENKTRKYFKYAIGEIILVVIGILIALQINNWNEQRKKDELGKDYLLQLKEDLSLDTKLYEEQIYNLTEQLKPIDNAVVILEKPDANISTLQNILINGKFDDNLYDNYDINNSTFLALQNSGNMNLIKKSIYNEVLDLNRAQKRYVRAIRDNSLALQEQSNRSLEGLPIGGNAYLKEQFFLKFDWDKNSVNIINLLYFSKQVNERHIEFTKEILNQTNALNELITREIENN
jgi:hypothetical protein